MADFEATGEELEKLVKLGRSRPMPFAFCPGHGEDDPLFATHRKKPPEIIARAARKASGQTKVAYGTFTVEDKVIVLVLMKQLPFIAKRLKKHLRRERLSLDIRILDELGNVLESDIDGEEDEQESAVNPPEAEADEDSSGEAWSGEEAAEPAAVEEEPVKDERAYEIAKRLKGLHTFAKKAPGPFRDKLIVAMERTAAQIKSGDLDGAETQVNKITNVIEKLKNA